MPTIDWQVQGIGSATTVKSIRCWKLTSVNYSSDNTRYPMNIKLKIKIILLLSVAIVVMLAIGKVIERDGEPMSFPTETTE